MDSTTGIITLSDFNNESAIKELIDKYHEDIISSSNLIFDVRKNAGGTDTAYLPLLSYIFPKKIMFSSLFADGDSLSMNCTRRNCNLRTELCAKYMKLDLDDFTYQYLNQEIEFYKKNFDRGFVLDDENSIDYEIKGIARPESIFILSDCYCGSSGDTFVQNSKKSDKVTVIGRNTMGITDYSNVIFADLGDYQLMYPTSKINKNGINGIGVGVDIYIPWTPDHLKKDIDLEIVLSMLNKKPNGRM